jgi:hypothetical protein
VHLNEIGRKYFPKPENILNILGKEKEKENTQMINYDNCLPF